MSYILDALKKAESERSRQSGPVLMDVRIAAPRRRLPIWAWVIGAVLLTNMLLLAWLLLRKPVVAPAQVAAQAAASATPAPPAVVPPLPVSQPAVPLIAEPAVIAPAAPAAAAPAFMPPVMPAEVPSNVDDLPTMQDLIASGVTLPALQLNLHVYDEMPGNRFVLLNSKRLREGDELPDGTRLERITPRGAVLNARGRRFVLVAGG